MADDGAAHPLQPTWPMAEGDYPMFDISGQPRGRGHVTQAGACVPVVIPDNAHATNAGHGAARRGEPGFVRASGRCDPVVLPENAFLDDRSHGPGAQHARGFEALRTGCGMIDLPANAHLDRSGNRWQCDRGFGFRRATDAS